MRLEIIHGRGPRAGTADAFSGEAAITLGRHPTCDVVYQEPGQPVVSGKHAELRLEGGRPVVRDLKSTNGTFVNGQRVESAALGPDDEVALGAGGPAFRVRLEAPPPAAEDAPKMYGQRTVGMMIQQALASAGAPQPAAPGTSKSTEYFEALVEKKVKRTSRRLKLIVLISAGAAALIAGVLVLWLVLLAKPAPVQVVVGDASGGTIAAANRFNVFMLAGYPTEGGKVAGPFQGFCTGFAVAPDVLATNAHCVKAAAGRFASVTALMNGAPANRFPVMAWVAHPGWQEGEISPDVGLLRIGGRLSGTVQLAGPAELSQVAPGVAVFLYGFPGRLNREDAPEATFIKGDIGRVTTFDQRLGDFGTNTLLQHSAFCTGGTSGSPMFNAAGRVVGINAGGYVENGQALAGYNFGMRADLINDLFALLPASGGAR